MPCLLFDERNQDADHGQAKQRHANRIELGAGRVCATRRGSREIAPGEHQRQGADREVDEEDRTPAAVGAEQRDQRSAEQRSDRSGDPDHGAEVAERLAALLALEHRLDEPADLRCDEAAGQSLDDAGDDEEDR